MQYVKKYLFIPFILLSQSAAASETLELYYRPDKKQDLLQSQDNTKRDVKPKLSWNEAESSINRHTYCHIPSQPGCGNMWRDAYKDKNYGGLFRYRENKLDSPHK